MVSCKSPKESHDLTPSGTNITFLDSTESALQIITDQHDSFFESLSIVDMAIQLRTDKRFSTRDEALTEYKNKLRSEVSSFTSEEQMILKSTMQEAKRLLDSINPKLWPNNIDLIKIRTNHYGPDVYYTREDAIFIPDNVFTSNRSQTELLPVILHEIYHILSRFDNKFRTDTYKLINFVEHHKKIKLSDALQAKRLTNPDGTTLEYAIKLSDNKGNSTLATPFIKSNQPYYSRSIPSFFAYINFDIYRLAELDDGSLFIESDKAGNTTLNQEYQVDYFNHISDNTQYVIHPEEIMADNFKIAALTSKTGDRSHLSESGKRLIYEILKIMKSYGN